MARALVGNAADDEQVKAADATVKTRTEREQADMAFVLADPRGRRVLFKVLEMAGTFASTWDHSEAMLRYKSARQELGHDIRRQIVTARPDAFLQMVQENLESKEKEDA